jgi:Domain of unknown function (DUF4091)/Family of unknown function (DUF6067)
MKYLLLLFIFLNTSFSDLQAQLTQPYLQLPVLKTAPQIDGKLSPGEWRNAALVSDYEVWTLDAYVPDKVETYVGYDNKYIYVSFKGFFSDTALFNSTLEEYKPIDSHLWGRNYFGVQVAKENASIDIKAGPSLSKMDFKNGDLAWNGAWEFAASVNDSNWIGEFKIPFTDVGIMSSPIGQTWRMNFSRCNPSGVSSEWSGNVKFAGNNLVTCKAGKWLNPLPGNNQLPIILENNQVKTAVVNCEIVLLPFKGTPEFLNQQGQGNSNAEMLIGLRGNPVFFKKKISIPAGRSLAENLPYTISSEGNYYAAVSCITPSGDTIMQSTGFWFTIAPNKERLITLFKKIGEAVALIKNKDDVYKYLLSESGQLESQINELKNAQKKYWDKREWKEITGKTDTLETRVLQFYQQVKFALLNQGKSKASYGVIATHALQKIKRDREFTGQFLNKAIISVARNESESFQLVFIPFKNNINNISITVEDLHTLNGDTLSKNNAAVSLVDYNNIQWQANYTIQDKGWHPDALIPVTKPFSLNGSEICRPVWITVRVPKNAKAGYYTGNIKITANNSETNIIPLELKVHDFELPDETHLKTHTWDEIATMQKFYNVKELPVSWYLNFCDVLLKNHLNPSFAGVDYVDRKNLIDGKYDFSKVEKILSHTIPKGLSRFSMVQMKKGDYPPGELEKEYHFIEAYANFLKSKGWQNKAMVELWDEPSILEWEAVKKRAERIHKISPDIKTQLFCTEGDAYKFWDTSVSKKYGLLDLIDLWMPVRLIEAPEIQKKGHEVWTYFATLPRSNAPNFYIDVPAIYQRSIPWYCWMYGVDGFEHWSTTYFWRNAKAGKPTAEKWPNVLWDSRTFHDFHGEGQLVYPGPDGQFFPSIRLETFRDGMDDYEYLYKLKELVQNFKGNKEDNFYREALRLLNAGETILIKYPETVQATLENTIRYPNEPERILEIREKIAAAIERFQKKNSLREILRRH